MVAGSCPFMGLYLDMEQGTVTPSYATPEAVERVVGPDYEPGDSGLSDQRSKTQLVKKQGEEKPMLNQKGNATTATTWQDNHSGYRRHKLMTKELGDTIPPLYANEERRTTPTPWSPG